MIRGLILLGLASQAYGLTTSAESVKLYLYTTNAACLLAKDTVGTTVSTTNLVSSKYFPLGECLETAAGGKIFNFGAPTGTSAVAGTKALDGFGVFNIGTDNAVGVQNGNTAKGKASAAETWKWDATTGALTYYSDAACATLDTTPALTAWDAALTAQSGNALCDDGNNTTTAWNFGPTGVTMLAKAGAGAAIKWVTIAHYPNDTAQNCAVTASTALTGGLEMFPVAASTSATDVAKACSRTGAADSHVFVCNAGTIEYHVHTANSTCAGSGTAVRKLLMPSTATGLCYNQSSTVATDAGTGVVAAVATNAKDSWKITNSAAEYATICPTPAAASGGAIASAVGAGLAAAALIL